jgi:hypothetical protein
VAARRRAPARWLRAADLGGLCATLGGRRGWHHVLRARARAAGAAGEGVAALAGDGGL